MSAMAFTPASRLQVPGCPPSFSSPACYGIHAINTAGPCAIARQWLLHSRHRRQHMPQAAAGAPPAADTATSIAPNRVPGTAPSTSQPGNQTQGEDWREVVLAAAADTGSQLVRIVLRGRPSEAMPYRSATVRPVMVKGKRQLQVSCLTAKQDLTSNYPDAAAATAALSALMALPWHSATCQTLQGGASIQITKKGKAIISRSSAAAGPPGGGMPLVQLAHDRAKGLPIPEAPDAFLQAIGLQSADGRVRASMRAKYAQINEFLKLLIHTGQLDRWSGGQHLQNSAASSNGSNGSGSSTTHGASATSSSASASSPEAAGITAPTTLGGAAHTAAAPAATATAATATAATAARSPVHIIDCGCGSAHLTFGAYHYINNVLGQPVVLTGVDANAGLMAKSNEQAQALGLSNARFHACSIREFEPAVAPDIVLALHACDTATDEALALGVLNNASIIMSVPCCHKTLHQQLSAHTPAPLGPMLRHGIVRQRMLDMLTDTMRAQLLRLVGYRTDIVEFISTEHTPRNLLIRAVRQQQRPTEAQLEALVAEYVALRAYWAGAPALEGMLAQLLPPGVLMSD